MVLPVDRNTTENRITGKIDVFAVVEANRDFPRYGSPTIVELQDGRLLLAWMESVGGPLLGNDHVPCNIAAMVSCDGGYI